MQYYADTYVLNLQYNICEFLSPFNIKDPDTKSIEVWNRTLYSVEEKIFLIVEQDIPSLKNNRLNLEAF